MAEISLINIKKYYGKNEQQQTVLDNLSLTIEKGEMIAIMGPSGSGKSTLMNIIGLLDKKYSGKYMLHGQDVSLYDENTLSKMRNKKLGFIFQRFHLIKELTAIENVEMNLLFSNIGVKHKDKINKRNIEKKAKEVLTKVGLEEHLNKKPGQLSGGQQQRVAIARALVNDPEIILADEPTGALDQKNGKEIMTILKKLNSYGKTIIIITHDKNISEQCKRKIFLQDGIIKESECQ